MDFAKKLENRALDSLISQAENRYAEIEMFLDKYPVIEQDLWKICMQHAKWAAKDGRFHLTLELAGKFDPQMKKLPKLDDALYMLYSDNSSRVSVTLRNFRQGFLNRSQAFASPNALKETCEYLAESLATRAHEYGLETVVSHERRVEKISFSWLPERLELSPQQVRELAAQRKFCDAEGLFNYVEQQTKPTSH